MKSMRLNFAGLSAKALKALSSDKEIMVRLSVRISRDLE